MTGPCRRRSLLRFGGATVLSGLAGCATIEAELGLRTERLGRVVLANSIDEPFEVAVEVLRDGTTVYDSSHRLAPGSPEERPQVVLDEWASDPEARRWEVRARTSTSGWRRAKLDAAVGGRDDCHAVHVATGDWPESPVLVVPTGCGRPLDPEATAR
jgi:hypothetical protein